MDIKVYKVAEIDNSKIKGLITQHASFVLTEVEHMGNTIETLESIIEGHGLSCRVYTKGRVATVAAAAIPISPTVIGGWLSGLAIAAHNLATYNPDYEIAKNYATSTLTITYKK